MRVLGVDPGIAKVGWGVVDAEAGKYSALAYDLLLTSPDLSLEKRLNQIHQFIVQLIEKYHPDVLAVENLYFSANVKTALTVGHARGVILLAASGLNLSVSSFTPLQVKQSLTGYGRADKRQIAMMVKSILKIPAISQDDTSDALAIALTYHFSQRMQALTAKL